jgi:anti-anti-sigma factor
MSHESTATYRFGDKIHIGNADGISVAIDRLFTADVATRIVLDMGNVRICDSYGLRLLVSFQRKATSTGKKLLLFQPDRMLSEMLAAVNLTSVFTIVKTREELDA